ncbi:MAG: response regulator [Candidatus Aminicenantes bacterium]|nr:response regulator [Candidatus Aminicenantes bacterium]
MEKKENILPLSLLLESYNFRVTMIESVDSIVEKILFHSNSQEPIDLLIINMSLSDQALIKLFTKLKKLNFVLPFILISEEKKMELMNHLLEMDLYGYVNKPSEPVILVEQVMNILENVEKYKKNAK